MAEAAAPNQPEYSAPALDKGLDILELLADQPGGLSQSEIAEAVGRSVGQIFRVLATLERRGYVARDRQSGLYSFSMKLFDLAHRHPPLRGLIAVATAPMRDLAERVRQSCNLSVLDAGRVRVIAQVESPADFGYRVRVGALFDVESTATGAVLTSGEAVVRPDALQPGITDVVVPVRDASGTVAALTVPYVATTFSATPEGDVVAAATATASAISRLLRGEPR
ncbi:IclR family transcriptional regulator [Salinibacterium soli]|uniref:Helix-turn-helix domain-containing protein n=1 Tax=Antiquaquibacter soli TaxID=3064523 RepID=A0ABT9BJ89_9MICO|nr:helix-turn-helix domain-containing protein [Protaetiibacter sp. WY-16]MDO7881084.1 helix-turn-helix domain-containing protein [Protaetiibacter sp. WY-16]